MCINFLIFCLGIVVNDKEYSYIILCFEVYDLKLETHCIELVYKIWCLIQIVI